MERYSLHKQIDMVLAHYSLTREKLASQIDISPRYLWTLRDQREPQPDKRKGVAAINAMFNAAFPSPALPEHRVLVDWHDEIIALKDRRQHEPGPYLNKLVHWLDIVGHFGPHQNASGEELFHLLRLEGQVYFAAAHEVEHQKPANLVLNWSAE